MKCLVTGAGGFIGSHVTRELLKRGNEVHIIVKSDTDLWRISNVKKDIDIICMDLASKEKVSAFFKGNRFQRIFHLATYGVNPAQKDMNLIFKNNIISTMNLISSLSRDSFESFIYAGSGFEYGFKDKPIKETEELNPADIYSFSKASISTSIHAFSHANNLPMNIARLFLVYGKYETPTRLIPTLIRSYKNKEPPKLNSPSNTRDFIYIEDAVDAIIRLSESYYCGEVFNIGSGREHTVKEVAEIVKEMFASDMEPAWGAGIQHSFEPQHWCADISKAEKMLGWKPKNTLSQGIKKTLDAESLT